MLESWRVTMWLESLPYLVFGILINIVSKEGYSFYVTIGDIQHGTCPNFMKMSSHVLEREGRKKIEKYCILILHKATNSCPSFSK